MPKEAKRECAIGGFFAVNHGGFQAFLCRKPGTETKGLNPAFQHVARQVLQELDTALVEDAKVRDGLVDEHLRP